MAYESEYGGRNRTITAFFDSRGDADDAIEKLVASGFPRDSITIVQGSDGQGSSASRQDEGGGFWEALANFFMPDEDRYTYAEGLRRGGYLVTVRTSDAFYDRALDILDDEGTVNMDEREQSWRSEGWRSYEERTDIGATGFWRGPDRSPGAGTVSGQQMASGSTRQQMGGATGMSRQQTQDMSRGGEFSREGTIPLAEEQLRVGKRDVSHGRVRVRSYVVEEPVSEDVTLSDEHVDIERRKVDRAASSGDGLFQDRTIEMEEHGEEPVVAKDARVTEEIALRKQRDERKETISDTVKHTEVEIEDDRDQSGFNRDR